jgi:hypothetical protein
MSNLHHWATNFTAELVYNSLLAIEASKYVPARAAPPDAYIWLRLYSLVICDHIISIPCFKTKQADGLIGCEASSHCIGISHKSALTC